MRALISVVAAACSAAAILTVHCSDTATVNRCNYLPLAVGNTWVYKWEREYYEWYPYYEEIEESEFTYEVTEHLGDVYGVDAYVIEITEKGVPRGQVTVGCAGDHCFVFDDSAERWEIIVGDSLPYEYVVTRGLIAAGSMQGEDHLLEVVVPAGTFVGCKGFSTHYEEEEYYYYEEYQ